MNQFYAGLGEIDKPVAPGQMAGFIRFLKNLFKKIRNPYIFHPNKPTTGLLGPRCIWQTTCAASKILSPQVHQVHSVFVFISLGHELVILRMFIKFIKFIPSVCTKGSLDSARDFGCGLPLRSRPQSASSSSSSSLLA